MILQIGDHVNNIRCKKITTICHNLAQSNNVRQTALSPNSLTLAISVEEYKVVDECLDI